MRAEKRRPQHRPSLHFNELDVPATLVSESTWYRLHEANVDPLYFSKGGRFSPDQGVYKVLYLGFDQETCVFEKFGDEIYAARNRGQSVCLSFSIWNSRCISKISLPALRICDLSKKNVLVACGVDLGSLMAFDFEIPHAWARAIMKHPSNFDAIKYISRFTKSPCLALFDKLSTINRINATPLGFLAELEAGENLLKQFSIALV